jgi:nucleoside-diphosphate-sugar epimerase
LKNIFITGASSYLGKNFLNKVSEHRIYALTNRNMPDHYENLIPVRLSTDEFNAFYNEKEIDTIVHLAANSLISQKDEDIEKIFDVNILLGNQILLSTKNSPVEKFITAGSYSQDIDESPNNLYKISKQIFEDLLRNFSLKNNIIPVSLHFGDIYGPNDTRDKLIPYLLKNENKNEVQFNSNGLGYFSPIHVCDAVDAIINELKNKKSHVFEKKLICSQLITVKKFVSEYKSIRNKKFVPVYTKVNKIKSYQKKDFKLDISPKVSLLKGLESLEKAEHPI